MLGFRSQERNAATALAQARAELTRISSEHAEGGSRAQTRIRELNEQFDALARSYGLQSTTIGTALIELKGLKTQKENEILETKGMGYMFDKFSEYTFGKIAPEGIKVLIIMLCSFLLELTVWQCSPDIRITRPILRYFVRSLPDDKDIGEILKIFDVEDQMFTKTPEELAQESELVKKLDEFDKLLKSNKEITKELEEQKTASTNMYGHITQIQADKEKLEDEYLKLTETLLEKQNKIDQLSQVRVEDSNEAQKMFDDMSKRFNDLVNDYTELDWKYQ
jgi:predicted RND superfamily exporter protein